MNTTIALAFCLGSLFGTILTYLLCKAALSFKYSCELSQLKKDINELRARLTTVQENMVDAMSEGFDETFDVMQKTFSSLYRIDAPVSLEALTRMNVSSWRDAFTRGLMHMHPHATVMVPPSTRNLGAVLGWIESAWNVSASNGKETASMLAAKEFIFKAKASFYSQRLDSARIFAYKALIAMLEFGPEVEDKESAEQVAAVREIAVKRAQAASDADNFREFQRYDAGLYHIYAALELLQSTAPQSHE